MKTSWCFSLAMLLLCPIVQAQIALQDGSSLSITHTTGTNISQSFTTTAGAKVMVVCLEDRGANLTEPSTLAWGSQTLTLDVQTAYTTGNARSLAIYHLYNPTASTATITGSLGAAVSDIWVTAYTLNGVDTTIAPITGSTNTGNNTSGVTSLAIIPNLTGVVSGSWASVSSEFANYGTVAINATNSMGMTTTGMTASDGADATTEATAGYVAGLSTGTVTLAENFASTAQKSNFAIEIFTPLPPVIITTQQAFGIKFLGNTTDNVTGRAGVIPISGWNNIANATYTSGTIRSSDGTTTATLALSGSGRANGWKSGTAANGGDGSLMDGYCDAMANSPMTVTISGLTGSSYTIYLYTMGDTPRPNSGTELIPNYTVNGSEIYTPTFGGSFGRYVQGGMTLANTNLYPSAQAHGNCIRWNNGVPVNGVITITANADNRSYRSPLNGIELVLNTNAAPSQSRPIHIMPLGDSITWGYPNAPTTGGYRLPLYQFLANENFTMDFVGTQVSTAPGLPYPNHEGHSGYRIDQIDDPYFLGWVNTVASPDIILLLIGTNDIGQDDDPTNAINRLDAFISHITADRPNAKLVVANLLPRSDTTDNNEINTLFNPFVPGVVAKHAANGEQVYFWDLHSQLTVNDTDGLHPTPSGYFKLGKQWFDAVNTLYASFTGINLALNKSITASSVNGSNIASNAVDGNLSSYWSSAAGDPQWLAVDLGSVQNINRAKWIWTASYGKSYQIQVSTDDTNWTGVYNTTNGMGDTNSVIFAPTNARYVRIYGNASSLGSGYGIYEFQVYATPLINLALNKTVTASSTSDAVNFPAANAVDGDATTHWSSQASDVQWITVDLGAIQNIGRVRLNWNAAYGQSYEIQVSTNNLNWTPVYNTGSGSGGIEDISFTAVNARYVRMYGMLRGAANGYSLNEFGIYGQLNSPANNQFQPLVYVANVTAVLSPPNSSIDLSWPCMPQKNYDIQYSSSLNDPEWYDYEPQVTASGSVANVLLPLDNESQKFYRVKPVF
jgi:lysophospholipase L1-like esterase